MQLIKNNMSLKIVAVTQARSGSTRLPGKVLMKIGDHTLLELHLRRILQSTLITQLVVATTVQKEDDKIEELANKVGLHSYRGSVNDVLDRFYNAISELK